jgi:hypothetical protein
LVQGTTTLIIPQDVGVDLKYKCICPVCSKEFVVINSEGNKVKNHFRHKSKESCSGRYESYIHILTKILFQYHIDYIEIPNFYLNTLNFVPGDFYNVSRKIAEDLYEEYHVPKEFRKYYRDLKLLAKSNNFYWDNCNVEKSFSPTSGDIKVDIVLSKGKDILLIEPFYTSGITENKLYKLGENDVSTLSINLKSFIETHGFLFSIDSLKTYLQSSISKEWVYIKQKKLSKLKDTFYEKLKNKINAEKSIYKGYIRLEREIVQKRKERNPIEERIFKLKNQIDINKKEILKIEDSCIELEEKQNKILDKYAKG